MGFRINTNVAAMSSHMSSVNNNKGLDKSLSALSTGLRINKASDDASGMAIANQLKSQAQGLGQSIRNANDGINVAQTADGALEEYTNIINTVRTKSIQAASDGQNADSRQAIQNDIDKLLEEANNIADTTSFNGQKLLNGDFQNKEFHIGAYADETVGMNISNTNTNAIGGHVNKAGTAGVSTKALTAGAVTIKTAMGGTAAVDIGPTVSGSKAGETDNSAWAKANAVNSVESKTGVHATAKTEFTTTGAITAATIAVGGLTINGVDIGAVDVLGNDSDGALMNAINAVSKETGVVASHDGGMLTLTSKDGRDITTTGATIGGLAPGTINGKVTLQSEETVSFGAGGTELGFLATQSFSKDNMLDSIDVTTREGAEDAILTADAALKQIDKIRSDIGSTQNQLESTVRNISVTQVNVTAAESSIRDVDFASESATLSKHNILAKSGVYAMSQANAAQQNVMTLLR